MTASHTSLSPLEPSQEDMRGLVDQAMEQILAYIASLPDQPAAQTEDGAALARALKDCLPEDGTPYADLLTLLFQKAIPASFNCAGPGYLAYVPGGGIFHAAVADLISNAVNRYVGVWAAAPGLAPWWHWPSIHCHGASLKPSGN